MISRRAFIGLGLLMVGSAAYFSFDQNPQVGDPTSPAANDTPEASRIEEVPSQRANTQSSLPQNSASRSLDLQSYLVEGIVVDEQGLPLGGINLNAYALDPAGQRQGEKPLYARTRENGTFSLRLAGQHSYQLVAEDNWTYQQVAIEVVPPAQPLSIVLSKISGTMIVGQVTNTDGNPLEGVLVTNGSGEFFTRTDENGDYQLRMTLPRTHLPVAAYFLTGFEAQQITITHKAFDQNPRVRRDIRLTESRQSIRVSGFVRDHSGQGISDIRLRLQSMAYNFIHTAHSQGDGRFVFEAVRPGARYRLQVFDREPYLGLEQHSIQVSDSMPPFELTLESYQSVPVTGQLIDATGKPLSGFRIHASRPDTSSFDRTLVTDDSGRFTIDRFPTGPIVLRTRTLPQFKVEGMVIDALAANDLIVPIDMGWHSLSGRVLDAQSIPVENARITLESSCRTQGVVSSSFRTTQSSTGGYFDFSGINQGEHTLSAYLEGHEPVSVTYQAGVQDDLVSIQFE